MKIKLKWKYAEGEMDTKTMKLICIKARGKRMCGPDEIDAELAIKDGMNFTIADIHLADVDNPIIQQAIEDSYSFKTGEIYEERKEI